MRLGNRELLASNDMDVVNAKSVEGKVEVVHWRPMGRALPLGAVWWRHKFDVGKGEVEYMSME